MHIKDAIQQKKTERRMTKQGYLVVPANLSRLGIFRYKASEIIKDGGDEIKTVARTENSLFTSETVESFENAPITIMHPIEDVTATNWKRHSVGFVRNVKREGDFLTGEAWVTDEKAIKLIQDDGLVEISCGYRSEILPTETGADFEFSPMIGNHIALVKMGRCGDEVKLFDKDAIKMDKEELKATLKKALAELSAEELNLVLEEAGIKTQPAENVADETPAEEQEQVLALMEKNEKLNAELAEVRAELETVKNRTDELETEKAVAEVRDLLPDFVAESAKTASDVKRQALVEMGAYSKENAVSLTDAAVVAGFTVLKNIKTKISKNNIGKNIHDSLSANAPENVNAWGGKVNLNEKCGGK